MKISEMFIKFSNISETSKYPKNIWTLWKGPVFIFHFTGTQLLPEQRGWGRGIFYFDTSWITVFVPVPLIDAKRGEIALIYTSSISLASLSTSAQYFKNLTITW